LRTLVVNALRSSGRRTAIGRHIEHLAQAWSRMDSPFDRIEILAPGEVRIDELGTATPVVFRSRGAAYPNLVWEQNVLPVLSRRAAALFSMYTCPLVYGGRIVVANHGIYEAIPETFSRWQRLRATPLNRMSARRANAVISNSHATKADLITYFGLDTHKVSVVYPGPAPLFFRERSPAEVEAEVRRAFGQTAPYVIFVGKLVKRRHVPELIEAFARACDELNLKHRLLLVGPNVAKVPVDALARQHGVGGRVVHIDHLEQDRLALLYSGAELFVLPPIYEGLSRTILEAMASGTAVLTVAHPVLAEGGGDAVHAVSAPRTDDLASGLKLLLGDSELRASYELRGRERAARFSITECARQTMEILDVTGRSADGVR
jgi:glycosyltransferase involved in cell wall biosynthesis